MRGGVTITTLGIIAGFPVVVALAVPDSVARQDSVTRQVGRGSLPVAAPSPGRFVPAPAMEVRRDRGATSQRLLVRVDGTWMFLPDRGSAFAETVNQGRLNATERAELTRLAGSAELAADAAAPGETCPGTSRYLIDLGSLTASWGDCEDARPAVAALIRLLRAATPI